MTTSSRMEHQHSIQPGYPHHHHHSHQESLHPHHSLNSTLPSSDLSQHSPKDSLPPLAYQKDTIASRRHDTSEGGDHYHHRSSEGSVGHYRLQHNSDHPVSKARDTGRLCNESLMQSDTSFSSSSGTSSPHEGTEERQWARERFFFFCFVGVDVVMVLCGVCIDVCVCVCVGDASGAMHVLYCTTSSVRTNQTLCPPTFHPSVRRKAERQPLVTQ